MTIAALAVAVITAAVFDVAVLLTSRLPDGRISPDEQRIMAVSFFLFLLTLALSLTVSVVALLQRRRR